MTDEQKQQIRKQRLEGMGYKAIASSIGISRDSVKSFCKRHGLQGNFCVVALNVEEKLGKNLICHCCQKPITQKTKGKPRKFCSDSCRRKWWKEHQDKRLQKDTAFYSFSCSWCNKSFKAYGNSNRKYCSHSCYIKARFGENAASTNHDWRELDGI